MSETAEQQFIPNIRNVGRPTKCTPERIQQAYDYLKNYETEFNHAIPSIIGMAKALNVHKSTLYDWADLPNNEFTDILKLCNDFQQHKLLDGGLKGELNSNIVKLALGKHGFHEKHETSTDLRLTAYDYSDVDPDSLDELLEKKRQEYALSKLE